MATDADRIAELEAQLQQALQHIALVQQQPLPANVEIPTAVQRAKLKEPEPFTGHKRYDVDCFLLQMATYLTVCGVSRDHWPAITTT
jgi:hypothetical protein